MSRLRALSIAMCGFLLACQDERPRPNVLLISVDSLRRDHVSAYGYKNALNPSEPTTPAVERLAARGVSFDDAVSTTSWTLPAHMAMLTGLTDPLHGVTFNDACLDPAFETLAETLRERGYATGGFFSGPNLHPVFGFGQGFDAYVDCSGVQSQAEMLRDPRAREFRDAHLSSHQAITSPLVLAEASHWIRERAAEQRPFFAFTHWWDVHYDYRAPAPYDRMYAGEYSGPVRGVQQEEKDRPLAGADLQHLKSLYDGEIRWTDEHIAKLLALLDELGLRRDTLVVFTSDHGEEFYERGRWGHRRTLYEEVVRIPLVMSWPAELPAGARVARQACIQDIYPTVARLCGAEVPEYVEGQDLSPTWSERGDARTPDRIQTLFLDIPAPLDIRVTGARRSGEKTLWDARAQRIERFDLVADPGEQAPSTQPQVDAQHGIEDPLLRAALADLERHRARLPASSSGKVGQLPPDVEAQLKSLGYLGDDGPEGGRTPKK